MMRAMHRGEHRTREQLREHYEIERELAGRLMSASRADRRMLYAALYDELFRRVPAHPQLTRKASPTEAAAEVSRQMQLIQPFLSRDVTYLEIGPGDCALSIEIAKSVKQAVGVDVSDTITSRRESPSNFRLVLSDGASVPVPALSVNVAYSNQLMEHLHPDDALEQLRSVHRALAPCGVYVCVTPNRLNGPHDVSRYFDSVATGLHLKEYTVRELCGLFREVGFTRVRQGVRRKRRDVMLPVAPIAAMERLLCLLPTPARKSVASMPIIKRLLGIRLIATK